MRRRANFVVADRGLSHTNPNTWRQNVRQIAAAAALFLFAWHRGDSQVPLQNGLHVILIRHDRTSCASATVNAIKNKK